jgi:hypothetical protein
MNVHAALRGAPARLSPDRALASIDELGLEWSC